MTKIEQAIVRDVATRHDLPEEVAARMVRSVLQHGSESVYFDVVAPSAMSIVRPLWGTVQNLIKAIGPMLADVTERAGDLQPPKCQAAVMNERRRPGDDTMICPMGRNATDPSMTCRLCGQASVTKTTHP